MDLNKLQAERRVWHVENFGEEAAHRAVLGVCEEAGELAHAQLKMEQEIRGDQEKHQLDLEDAAADIIIYLCGVADDHGFWLGDVLEEVWDRVKQRDWKEDPVHGGTKGHD